MKKLKRRLSHAFKSGSSLNLSFENNNPTSSSLPTGSSLTKNGADRNDSNGHRHASENDHECNGNNTSHIAAYDNTYNTANLDGSFSSCSSLSIPSVSLSLANCAHPVVPPTSYNPNGPNTGASRYVAESGTGGLGYAGRGQQYRSWSRLSDSMNHLADRLAQDGIIVEEYNMDDISTNQQNIDSKSGSTKSSQQLNIPNRPSVPNYNSTNSRHYSMNGNQRLQPAPLMNKLISNHSHHQLSTLASNPNIANKDFSNGGALNASNRGYLGSTSANNRANASGSTNTMMTSLSLSKPCLQTANSLNTQRHSHGSLLDIQMIDSYNGYPNVENSNKNSLPSFVTMRPSKQSNTFSSADASMQAEAKKTSRNANKEMKKKSRNSWHASRWFFGNHNGRASSAVVHESSALGSDGESLEVSPCTSDQMSNSSFYPCSSSMYGVDGDRMGCQYVPNVKMRQKLNNRRWSEQDIQKRLSLPADIKLPQTVIEKLNRTPTLDNPLTRKSRRASLSEIGFGKLETYKKIFDLGKAPMLQFTLARAC